MGKTIPQNVVGLKIAQSDLEGQNFSCEQARSIRCTSIRGDDLRDSSTIMQHLEFMGLYQLAS
jgi:hypothetical protein